MTPPFLKARVKRETIPKLYRFIAPFHDGLALVVERKARDVLITNSGIRNGDSVLEVGVGTGLNFPRIVDLNPEGRTVGVDITPAMLARARKRMLKKSHTKYELLLADAYELPFERNTFDVVINSYMFDLLSARDMITVLKEFSRVLKPGGTLALAYMSPGERWFERFWDSLYRIHPFILGGCRGVTAIPYLDDTGFDHINAIPISYRTFPSEIIIATAR
ncbi:MAG: methyltransferase domain-containing protein [Rhodothermales bacterium]|nr:methyltransferase domain-containing protein [Rhodothermales bacterium]